jgi:hypothetical protein
MFAHINADSLSKNLGKNLGKSLGKYVGKKMGRTSPSARYIKIGAVVGVVGIAAAAIGFIGSIIYRQNQRSKAHGQVEAKRDKTLKDSFPASDPPATQFFDIPVNRQ